MILTTSILQTGENVNKRKTKPLEEAQWRYQICVRKLFEYGHWQTYASPCWSCWLPHAADIFFLDQQLSTSYRVGSTPWKRICTFIHMEMLSAKWQFNVQFSHACNKESHRKMTGFSVSQSRNVRRSERSSQGSPKTRMRQLIRLWRFNSTESHPYKYGCSGVYVWF